MKDDNCIEYWDAVDSNRYISQPEGEHKALFQAAGWYPFCKRMGNTVFDNPFSKLWDDEEYPDPTLNEYYHFQAWLGGCGLWDILRTGTSGHDSIDPPYNFDDVVRHAILKKYEISNPELPIMARSIEYRFFTFYIFHLGCFPILQHFSDWTHDEGICPGYKTDCPRG